jgi:hypothetical protein
MSQIIESPYASTALPAEDRRATAIRILLALAEVDPTVSGATLVLPDGSVTYLDAATLRRGGRA